MGLFKTVVLVFGLAVTLAAQPSTPAPKEKVIIISWGDLIGDHAGDKRFEGALKMDTAENMRPAAELWKKHGVNKVLFRVDDFRQMTGTELYLHEAAEWGRITRAAWKADLLKEAVTAMKAAGIQIYMWISIVDEGAPPEILYNDTVSFPWQTTFMKEHPEYQSCDRSLTESGRKYHWGMPEFAYPEVRKYALETIAMFSDRYAFDGVFLSFRSHSPPPDYADQFGFNQPVVEEYQKRYGKNILREDFDLEKWRALRGEFFTTFLREVSAHVKAHGQKLSLGVPQGEHAGPPYGNMQLQWRTWVSEKILDELVIGHHTISRAIYRARPQLGWGYVQDQEAGIGLPPIGQSLAEDYAPFCKQYGVKLYLDVPLGNFHRVFPDITMGKGVETPEATAKFEAAMEKISDLTGLVVDGRPYNVPIPN